MLYDFLEWIAWFLSKILICDIVVRKMRRLWFWLYYLKSRLYISIYSLKPKEIESLKESEKIKSRTINQSSRGNHHINRSSSTCTFITMKYNLSPSNRNIKFLAHIFGDPARTNHALEGNYIHYFDILRAFNRASIITKNELWLANPHHTL